MTVWIDHAMRTIRIGAPGLPYPGEVKMALTWSELKAFRNSGFDVS